MRILILGLIFFSHMGWACPDHLLPIEPFDRTGYNQAVYASLLEKRRELFGFVERPSFEAESAIYSLADYEYDEHGEIEWAENGLPLANAWYLELAEANENIYYASAREGKKPSKTEKVKRTKVPISKQQYETLFYALNNLLIKTAYTNKSSSVLDGTSYMFFSSGRYGEVHSYCAKEFEAGNLLAIYRHLYNYIKSNGKEKDVLNEAMHIAKQIASRPHNQ